MKQPKLTHDYRLTIDGYRNPDEPEHQYFYALPGAQERAWKMNLKHYSIWELRDKRWVCIRSVSL